MYEIFVREFNIYFHVPKKDRCDTCEEVKSAEKNGIQLQKNVLDPYDSHIVEKTAMRTLLNSHREAKNALVVCFDLQNVINVPYADISSFFYKRKLTIYNLTAHTSINKKGYCAIWTEAMSGRDGNDIASAFIRILTEVVKDYPNEKDIIVWSDSCVPQNRNQIISFAIMVFLRSNWHNVNTVSLHYSTPGHSAVQEVDL